MNLHIECTIAGEDLLPAKAAALRDLIIQPQRPWFSATERAYVEGALQGRFADVAFDSFTTAWLDDEPVGNVMVSVACSAPQIGLLSFVFTRPDQRGRGTAGMLMRDAIARFRAGGGVCMHLGTDNPAARRLYAACGFHDYNGHVMRFLDAGDSDQAFDRAYFASIGPASIRPGNWGDMARVGFLYAAPHPWFIKDYAERLYGAPEIEQARVGSILPSMMLNTTERGGALWVMENQAGHVVGAATVTCLDQTAQRHAPLLDVLIAPAYVAQAGDLVQTAIDGLRGGGSRQVWAYVAACDQDKAAIVQAAGFSVAARLPDALSAGERRFDLDVYVLPVP